MRASRKPVKRVLHVTFGLDVGGQEKLLVEFARHADRERFGLRFVSLGTLGRPAEDIAALGWPVTAAGNSERGCGPTFDRPARSDRSASGDPTWSTPMTSERCSTPARPHG